MYNKSFSEKLDEVLGLIFESSDNLVDAFNDLSDHPDKKKLLKRSVISEGPKDIESLEKRFT
jgi:hypothetical protein